MGTISWAPSSGLRTVHEFPARLDEPPEIRGVLGYHREPDDRLGPRRPDQEPAPILEQKLGSVLPVHRCDPPADQLTRGFLQLREEACALLRPQGEIDPSGEDRPDPGGQVARE